MKQKNRKQIMILQKERIEKPTIYQDKEIISSEMLIIEVPSQTTTEKEEMC